MGNNEINDVDLEKHVILTCFADDFASKIDGVINLKKDDVILIRVSDDLCTEENSKEIKKMFKNLGFDNKVLMLNADVKINILRKED